MLAILRRIWRIILRAITCNLLDSEDNEHSMRQAIEDLRVGVATMRSSVAQILACQYRLQRDLINEQDKLAELDPGSMEWESCRERVAVLEIQLDSARIDSSTALTGLQRFRKIVQQSETSARDAQLNKKLAQMRAQVEQLALDRSLDEHFAALERLNDDARDAQSRAQAIRELNIALGQDSVEIQKEEPGEQRITGSD